MWYGPSSTNPISRALVARLSGGLKPSCPCQTLSRVLSSEAADRPLPGDSFPLRLGAHIGSPVTGFLLTQAGALPGPPRYERFGARQPKQSARKAGAARSVQPWARYRLLTGGQGFCGCGPGPGRHLHTNFQGACEANCIYGLPPAGATSYGAAGCGRGILSGSARRSNASVQRNPAAEQYHVAPLNVASHSNGSVLARYGFGNTTSDLHRRTQPPARACGGPRQMAVEHSALPNLGLRTRLFRDIKAPRNQTPRNQAGKAWSREQPISSLIAANTQIQIRHHKKLQAGLRPLCNRTLFRTGAARSSTRARANQPPVSQLQFLRKNQIRLARK